MYHVWISNVLVLLLWVSQGDSMPVRQHQENWNKRRFKSGKYLVGLQLYI